MERRKAEKLAYVETLASGLAHEIKNPLVAIKTFAQLLPRRQGDEGFLESLHASRPRRSRGSKSAGGCAPRFSASRRRSRT